MPEVEAEPDPLLLAWARLAGVGRAFPPEKWQDRPGCGRWVGINKNGETEDR